MKCLLHVIVPDYFWRKSEVLSERTNFTNYLLLLVITGVLFVSGGLQCALDCLTSDDSLHPAVSLQAQSDRCDNCHPVFEHTEPSLSCLNKACHQRLPYQRNLGGPQIYRLEKLAQPLFSNSRQPTPQYRAGSAIVSLPRPLQPKIQRQATSSEIVPQTLFSIRTTVILC